MGKGIEFKITAIFSFILLGISALLGILFFINNNETPMLYFTYILVAIAAVITILFTVFGIFQSKESMKSSLVVLGIAAVVVLVSYILASDATPTFFGYEDYSLTKTALKLIDSSLILMYILTGVSFLGLLYTEISRAIK